MTQKTEPPPKEPSNIHMRKLSNIIVVFFVVIGFMVVGGNNFISNGKADPDFPLSKMEYIQGGRFSMGCRPDNKYCQDQELPMHNVEIEPFYIATTEVTYHQYAYYCDQVEDNCETHSVNVDNFEKIKNLPVTQVSWNDAQNYIAWLNNQKGGQGYRLPTEAEWEYAARAGSSTYYYWGHEPSGEYANGRDPSIKGGIWPKDGYDKLSPVGAFHPNAWKLHDMSGNVKEWCQDWYGEDYYKKSPSNNPKGPVTGEEKVLRGGTWYSNPQFMRHSHRDKIAQDYKNNGIGFRLARDD